MNMKKSLLFAGVAAVLLFSACKMKPKIEPSSIFDGKEINPTISSTASVSQDFIFNTDSVGITTISIRRSEWNKMLSYFDYFYKNENSVLAECYEYSKGGKKWKLNTVGLRLRGNTSRFRPQGKDSPTDELGNKKANESWSKDYYNYAATCDDYDYRQSHFKVDFEPLDGDDRKMSDCMKGVALKRSDSYFSKEIFCYHMFHQYGIWTAPRASQTKVYITFIEDVDQDGNVSDDLPNCKLTKVDFGVYEMFEEVNKQSLKGRMSKKGNNSAENAWVNNSGDLWKCSGGDLTQGSNDPSKFGVEDIRIVDTSIPRDQWLKQDERNMIWYNPCYDLKTNKASVDSAALKFQDFISELNELSATSASTEAGISARKAFYEKWFDVDFFIKTYAVNMLVGMDDDYWGNKNNYYLYFDNGSGGSGKCYFIPFDYDNTLGSSITGDKTYTDPFKWGNGNDRPLLDRLLEVPEYKNKMKAALLEVSSQDENSPWNKDKCFALWNKWHSQVEPYVVTKDIKGWPNVGSTGINDDGGWKAHKHYLTQDADNFYEQVTANFRYWLSEDTLSLKFDFNGGKLSGSSDSYIIVDYNGMDSSLASILGETPIRDNYIFAGWTKTKNGKDYVQNYNGESGFTVYASWKKLSEIKSLVIYEIDDSSYEGIKIGIKNPPKNNYRRSIYINGKEVGADDCNSSIEKAYGDVWAYPYTEPGNVYNIYVTYSDVSYNKLEESNHISIKAKSGIGEFKVTNTPEYKIENNILKWVTAPEIQIGNGVTPASANGYYLLEVASTSPWVYLSWNGLGSSYGEGFNFKEHIGGKDNSDKVLSGEYKNLYFKLRYICRTEYGEEFLNIYDWGDVKTFNIK